eukprot:765155-Hanusia_phi.AAC.1
MVLHTAEGLANTEEGHKPQAVSLPRAAGRSPACSSHGCERSALVPSDKQHNVWVPAPSTRR